MCSLTLALTGLTTGLQMAGQYQQSRAQAASLNAQAEAANQQAEATRAQAETQRRQAEAEYQNARIQSRKGEQIAEQYAQQQRQLNDRRRAVIAQQNAAAGASGIIGGLGSGLDAYTATNEAWEQDSINLLSNQRNATYDNYVQEVNQRNAGHAMTANAFNTDRQAQLFDIQAKNYRSQASAAKQAGNLAMVTTLLGSAASMIGVGGGGGASSGASATAQTPTAAGITAQTADTINSGISGAAGWVPQYSTGAIRGVTQTFGPKVLNTPYGSMATNGRYF